MDKAEPLVEFELSAPISERLFGDTGEAGSGYSLPRVKEAAGLVEFTIQSCDGCGKGTTKLCL